MPAIDIYDDNGRYLREFLAQNPDKKLEKLVKSAAFVNKETASEEMFAFPEERKFPIVDKGNTCVSVLYFLRDPEQVGRQNIQKVAERLREACVDFNVLPPKKLVKLAETKPEEPFEYPESAFEPEKKFQRTLALFLQHKDHLEPADRRQIAVQLRKEARALGKSLPEEIEELGGAAINPELPKYLEQRAVLVKSGSPDVAELFEDLINVIENEPLHPDELVMIIGELDKSAGLADLYDSVVPDPYQIVFTAGNPFDNPMLKKRAAFRRKIELSRVLTPMAKKAFLQNPEYLSSISQIVKEAILGEESEEEPECFDVEEAFRAFLESPYAEDLEPDLVVALHEDPGVLHDLPYSIRKEVLRAFQQFLEDYGMA